MLAEAPSWLPASGSPHGAWQAQLWGTMAMLLLAWRGDHQAVMGSRHIVSYTFYV